MTITDGYYIAYCTSIDAPLAHQDNDTFYFPIDVKTTSDGYEYKEYRINLNTDMTKIPTEIISYLAKELDYYRKAIEKIGDQINQNPEKLGYKWKATYTNGNFNYTLVEDDAAIGTQKNPIRYNNGMLVKEYFFYVYENNIYVGVGTGIPDSITDSRYLEKM